MSSSASPPANPPPASPQLSQPYILALTNRNSQPHTSRSTKFAGVQFSTHLPGTKMAKETPTLSKDERRALKAAKKEAKASKPEGVTKLEKKDKKEKKDKTVLAERALKEIQNGNATTVKGDEGSEEEADAQAEEENEVKGKKSNGTTTTAVRPIGALVPFANPLADEKVAKKVFKGVKKGVCFSLLLCYSLAALSLIPCTPCNYCSSHPYFTHACPPTNPPIPPGTLKFSKIQTPMPLR